MILIIQSLWNEAITEKLTIAAQKYLEKKGYENDVIQVPGALEIPVAIKWAWSKAQQEQIPFEGVVVCGAVVKGETYHFEIVANESARALTDLSVSLRIPIGNAILAVYTLDQAIERAGGKLGNKGEEAAEAVIQMLKLKEAKAY